MEKFKKIVKTTLYYSSSFFLSIILTLAIFVGIGYYYYNNFYLEYLDVQKQWATVDQEYVHIINKVSNELPIVKETLSKDKSIKEEKNKEYGKKISIIELTNKNAAMSMSYEEKLLYYTDITKNAIDLKKITDELKLKESSDNLSNIDIKLNDFIKEYNTKAKTWNDNSTLFPNYIIADLGHFHNWTLIK